MDGGPGGSRPHAGVPTVSACPLTLTEACACILSKNTARSSVSAHLWLCGVEVGAPGARPRPAGPRVAVPGTGAGEYPGRRPQCRESCPVRDTHTFPCFSESRVGIAHTAKLWRLLLPVSDPPGCPGSVDSWSQVAFLLPWSWEE